MADCLQRARVRGRFYSEIEVSEHVIVWDLETVPDLESVARCLDLPVGEADAAREHLGDKFPKHVWHKIVCIGALVASRRDGIWNVEAVGAPHIEQRDEATLIDNFVWRIAERRPTLVTFNGNGFDLPVLRYRAMLHRISAPGLSARPYFNRYSTDAIDLCDVLGSYGSGGKATLHEICRTLGLEGKPGGIDGSKVSEFVDNGRIAEVAAYCESDVINTYRLWLIHELFCGRLTKEAYDASEAALHEKLRAREMRHDEADGVG